MSSSTQKAVVFATAVAVEEAFYDALQRGDLVALMSLWAADEDIVCVHPGRARLVGYPAVSASWKSIFEHQGNITVRPIDYKVFESATLSVHCVIEEIIDQATRQVIHCSAVNVYSKIGAGWRILMHHSSPTDGAELTAVSVGAMLH